MNHDLFLNDPCKQNLPFHIFFVIHILTFRGLKSSGLSPFKDIEQNIIAKSVLLHYLTTRCNSIGSAQDLKTGYLFDRRPTFFPMTDDSRWNQFLSHRCSFFSTMVIKKSSQWKELFCLALVIKTSGKHG